MKPLITLLLSTIFVTIGFSQTPLRHFTQSAESPIHKIPYGNNPKAGHFLRSGDANIYYEVYGKGQTIALLHGGLFGSTIELSDFIDSLSKKYQVIAISTRGHGKSEIGTEPVTLEQRAKDAITVINQVTKEKVIILGFSDGGYTAYKLGATYPDRVKKMIVIGAGIIYPGSREFGMSAKQAMQLDPVYWKQQLSLMPEPNRVEEVFQNVVNCYRHLTLGKDLLSTITCPVLVMAGDRDDGNSVQNVLNAALLIPNHQLAIIPNAGHAAFLINFAAVWASIAPFINES